MLIVNKIRFVIKIVMFPLLAILISSCEQKGSKNQSFTQNEHSSISEMFLNNISSSSTIEKIGLKKESERNGKRYVYFTLIFLAETKENGKIYFQNSPLVDEPVDSYHTKLVSSIPEYQDRHYFDLISSPNKELSAGYLYVKLDHTGEVLSPIGVEMVLLENGQNLSDPLKIIQRKDEISKTMSMLKQAFSAAENFVYTKADILPENVEQLKNGLFEQSQIAFEEFTKLVGTRNPVYTVGTSYGYLKKVSAEETLNGNYTFRDVIIIDQQPLEISPISGIISSRPQSPLSHVIMKTNQLNVPNIYIENPETVGSISKFLNDENNGNLVELIVKGDGSFKITGKGSLHNGGMPGILLRGRANRFWKKLRPQNLPEIRLDLTRNDLFKWRNTAVDRRMISSYGAKGVNFALLDNLLASNQVAERSLFENSFLIPFSYYHNHTQQNLTENLCSKGKKYCQKKSSETCQEFFEACHGNIGQSIDYFIQTHLSGESLERMRADSLVRNRSLYFIQGVIRSAKMIPADIQNIREALTAYPTDRRLRFRSSTNAEDLPGISGAGLYDSKSGCQADDLDSNASHEGSLCQTGVEKQRINNLIDELSNLDNPPSAQIEDLRESLLKKKPVEKAVTRVFASLWNPSAFNDREFYGIDHLRVKMGILVHPSFIDETANGVAVVDETGEEIKINISVQIDGISITNPELVGATADNFIADREGNILRYLSRSNRTNGRPVLSDRQIRDLVRQLLLVHKDQKSIQGDDFTKKTDLEFKFDAEGKVLIKQARPL